MLWEQRVWEEGLPHLSSVVGATSLGGRIPHLSSVVGATSESGWKDTTFTECCGSHESGRDLFSMKRKTDPYDKHAMARKTSSSLSR